MVVVITGHIRVPCSQAQDLEVLVVPDASAAGSQRL